MLIIETLAAQLAPAYQRANRTNVQDDVSLCLWAKEKTGDRLTLGEGAKLREKMDSIIAKFPKVVIFVEGGVVQACTSNDERLRVVLVNRDNLEEEADPAQAEAEVKKGTEDCVHDVF